MKTILFTLTAILCFATLSKAKEVKHSWQVYYDNKNSSSFAMASYTETELSNGDMYHTLSCSGIGSMGCCWPACSGGPNRTIIVSRDNYSCDIETIYEYINTQVAAGYNNGNTLYGGVIPIEWHVYDDNSMSILVN